MATATAADYSTTTVANGLYYPLSSNPASYLVAADIAGKANTASPALTGNVTITSNSTGAALFIEQAGTGNILTLHDQASDTTFVAIDQNGKVNTIPAVAASAGFNVPHGAAPTTPVNGDIWTTTSGLFMRQNGSTKQYVDLDGTQTINGAKTFSNASLTFGNATAASTVNIASGANGSAVTKTVNLATGGQSGSTTNVTIGSTDSVTTVQVNGSLNVNGTSNIGTSTGTFILGLANGATTTGQTKTVNIGTAGVAGSTTNIAIGSTTGTSTTTLQGITNGVTQTAGDSSLKLATTAFVTTADNLKANLASPALTGVPTAPTATLGTNTTQIATTAFVLANAPAAPVTSVAGRTGAITLANTDISGLGTMSTATAADYSTTTVANGLYYPLSSNPAGYLTTAPVTSVAGRTGAVTLSTSDISGLGTAATFADTAFLKTANNLSELTATASTARTNLGLGTMSTATAADYSTTTAANALYYPLSGNPSSFLVAADIAGKANIASPSLTGTPLSTTAAVDTNTTQIATTAYVVAQAASATPLVNGTAAVGTSTRYARADHVHGTDTTRAPLASPTFTGTPSLPTGTIAVTQTAGNNTTAVATTAFVTAAIPTNNVKAWVNFNGTGTVSIRASMNVSSITDNGAGDYTMNFTTALADANYAAAGFAGDAIFSVGVTLSSWGTYTQTTSAFRFKVYYSGSTTIDTTNVHMTIHR
jgi:hypothetical protein